jgi:hypothetical protein
VAGIGQQGQGAGHQASNSLGRHKGDIQSGADGEGRAKIPWRMAVTSVPVACVMTMTAMVMIPMNMIIGMVCGRPIRAEMTVLLRGLIHRLTSITRLISLSIPERQP